VAERGIVLTGGGALLRDIDKLIMKETDCRSSSPTTADLRGARRRRILELMEEHGRGIFGLN